MFYLPFYFLFRPSSSSFLCLFFTYST
jgi:hypothetical protein